MRCSTHKIPRALQSTIASYMYLGMSLYKYFQLSPANLPSTEEAGIGKALTTQANSIMPDELENFVYLPMKNGLKSANMLLKIAIVLLYEEVLFRCSYLTLVKAQSDSCLLREKWQSGEAAPSALAIPSKKRGRPLTFSELDNVVQQYIQSLGEAGTP